MTRVCSSRSAPHGACAALALCLAWNAGGAVQTEEAPILRRVLVMAGLQQRLVNVVSLSEQELVARDASSGASVRVPLSNVRALLPVMMPLGGVSTSGSRRGDFASLRRSSDEEPSVLVTTDTQSLPGRPGAGLQVTASDQLPWQSDVLGGFVMPLDNVQRLLRHAYTPERAVGTTDRVYLRNADILEGFVELMPQEAGSSITLSVDTGNGRTARVDWSSVESVEFAATPAPPRGAWAWLSDATSVRTTAVSISPRGDLTLSWDRGTVSEAIPAASLWAFAPSREHIDALAARPLVGVTPGDQRRFAAAPRGADTGPSPLGAHDLEVIGPVTAVWDLGPAAVRLAGTVEMAPSDRVWGDCTVTLEEVPGESAGALTAAGHELWTARISGDTPTATFSIDLTGKGASGGVRLLRVRVGEGENGPVQDRVWLRRVLIER